MLELSNLINLYSSSHFNVDELIHLQSIYKFKSWLLKTDKEKQECRKSHLKMLLTHFKDEKDLEYQKQAVVATDKILLFLQNSTFGQLNFDHCSKEDKCFFRIYNMLWCEKEYIFYGENLRSTRVHIPFSVFESLISEVKFTERYQMFKLEELFTEYNKMLILFESTVL